MIWQDGFSGIAGRTDPEEERELRLAAQARAGAEWALGALIARYQPPVTRYLTRLSGNHDFARRAAEQIFVRMERRIRGPQGGHNLRLWLLRACTEAGLEFLRAPSRPGHTPLAEPQPAALLTGRGGGAAQKLRAGIGSLANLTGTTGRQVRELIFPDAPPPEPHRRPAPIHAVPDRDTGNGHSTGADGTGSADNTDPEADPYRAVDPSLDTQDPREALRHRLVRAVLAELPYGDAQCLALHLVAGLNQAQVARALGITNGASRRRIVQGLQLFAQRYEAAAASLGLPDLEPEPEPQPQPAFAPMPPVREVQDTADVPTRILPSLDATAAAAAAVAEQPDAYDGYAAAPDDSAAEAPAAPEEEQLPWTPEVATVVEPRHEIIVDSTPPDTADVEDLSDDAGIVEAEAAETADAGASMDAGAGTQWGAMPFIVSAAPRPPEPRVVESTVAAVRLVPALTPLQMPEPQVPPEVAPAALRWNMARAVPVLTGPLPATHAEPGPSFAAEPGAVRRVPVLTAGAEASTAADEVGETDGDTAATARHA
ncbi:MAG TPA: sigma factor-like helix-turn-helix DNA-binding protein [Ktedonobacterales bacterium]